MIISWQLFEKGQDLQTSPVFDHSNKKGPIFVWLLSLYSVAILPFWGHPDLDLSLSVCKEDDLLVCWSILLQIDGDL